MVKLVQNLAKFFIAFCLLTSFSLADELDKMIGQMIIIGFRGNSIHSWNFRKISNQIKKQEIGGVILFSQNIKSKNDLIKMNNKLLSMSNIPPIISIDNEGGQIQRHNFFNNKSAKEISLLNEKQAKEEYQNMAKSLKELNFNTNFAPCVDLEINQNSIIKKKNRSYGINSNEVVKFASIFIEEHNKEKIITSMKHFPGHGSIKEDTHLGFADATNNFQEDELTPYFKLKKYDKLNMVMVSHIFNSKFDDTYPASLSKKTIKNFLIDEIGFNGVIISDDYDMLAIRNNYSLRDIIVNSINSGVNIMLFSNNLNFYDRNIASKIHKIINDEIKKGNIKLSDIENSYNKIINLKSNL